MLKKQTSITGFVFLLAKESYRGEGSFTSHTAITKPRAHSGINKLQKISSLSPLLSKFLKNCLILRECESFT